MKDRKELFSRIAYASGDIYGGGAFVIVGLLLLVYLTNVEGFSGTLAGAIVFTGKAWDAITDPFMGQLSDRTRSPTFSFPLHSRLSWFLTMPFSQTW